MAQMTFWRWAKVYIFNLPDPAAARQIAPKAVEPANALGEWSRLSQEHHEPAARPWATVVEGRKTKSLKQVSRWIFWAVIGFAVLTGVRSWFSAPATTGPGVPASAMFPAAAASGVAERFASAYYTWDEGKPQDRADALGPLIANGGDGSTLGWDGKGVQTAGQAHTFSVDAVDSAHARVSVSVPVTPSAKSADGKSWTPGKAVQLAVEVQIEVRDGYPYVVGSPGAVAAPTPPRINAVAFAHEDTDLTGQTKDYAKTFFKTYSQTGDVSAITAPGASIAGLGGGVAFKDLSSWSVAVDGGDSRAVHATVKWTVGGAVVEQNYSLTITKVTAGGADRWQISRLAGGN